MFCLEGIIPLSNQCFRNNPLPFVKRQEMTACTIRCMRPFQVSVVTMKDFRAGGGFERLRCGLFYVPGSAMRETPT